jgi:hypothetical protein
MLLLLLLLLLLRRRRELVPWWCGRGRSTSAGLHLHRLWGAAVLCEEPTLLH